MISFVVATIFTITSFYYLFPPEKKPPDYVYVLVYFIFFSISYLIANYFRKRVGKNERKK